MATISAKRASGIDADKVVTHAKQWIEAVTGRNITNLFEDVKSGSLLCNLVNHLSPGIVPDRKFGARFSNIFARMENINFFLDACKKLGLREAMLFEAEILQTEKGLVPLCITIFWLARAAGRVGFRGPTMEFSKIAILCCIKCGDQINESDEYFIDLLGQTHIRCLPCSQCKELLDPDEEFSTEGDVLCHICLNRRYSEERSSGSLMPDLNLTLEEDESGDDESDSETGKLSSQAAVKEAETAENGVDAEEENEIERDSLESEIEVTPSELVPSPRACILDESEASPSYSRKNSSADVAVKHATQARPIVARLPPAKAESFFPEKEGYLYCCKGFKQKWKKTYGVIEDGNLNFYNKKGEDRRLLRSLPPTKCSVAGIVAKEKERAYAILSSNPAIRISMSNKSSEEGHASELDQLKEWVSAVQRSHELFMSRSRRMGLISANRRLSTGAVYTKEINSAFTRNVTARHYNQPSKKPCDECQKVAPTWQTSRGYLCLACSEGASTPQAPRKKESKRKRSFREPKSRSNTAKETKQIMEEDKMKRRLDRDRVIHKRRLNILSRPISPPSLIVEPQNRSRIRSQAFEQLSICSTAMNISDIEDDQDEFSDDDGQSGEESSLDTLGIQAYSIRERSPKTTVKNQKSVKDKDVPQFTVTEDGHLSPKPAGRGILKWQRDLSQSAPIPAILLPEVESSSGDERPSPIQMEKEDKYDKLLGGGDSPRSGSQDGEGDWNKRFQSIMQDISLFSPNTPEEDQIAANLALIGLVHDFMYSARNYGEIIISEVYLSDREKTLKPVKIGGAAGGSKYIVHNILFKFALDTDGLYGGDDALAAKVAGHELQGLQAYFNCNIPHLCLPLMALVDYRGFRLIAMSKLPISKETLVYGTNDGGQTMKNSSPTLDHMMRQAAKMLNLKSHFGGLYEEKRIIIHSPADLEGHKAKDGRYYLVDFSRTFPCEFPDRADHPTAANLTNLLRPEFVKQFAFPLCSDAFSNFTDGTHNGEIAGATEQLQWDIIPRVGRDLPNFVGAQEDLTSVRLTEYLHGRGINIRWLGGVYLAVNNMASMSRSKNDCKTLLLQEMFARVIKNDLRKRLRTRMKKKKLPLEEPYRKLVADYLNLVFGNSPASDEYWLSFLIDLVEKKFKGVNQATLTTLVEERKKEHRRSSGPKEEKHKRRRRRALASALPPLASRRAASASNLRRFSNVPAAKSRAISNADMHTACVLKQAVFTFSSSDINGCLLLLGRVQEMVGFKIAEKVMEDLPLKMGSVASPISRGDVEHSGERIKHMNIVLQVEGYLLMMKGLQTRTLEPKSSISYFKMAIQKFEDELRSNPNSKVTLRNCARALMALEEQEQRALSGSNASAALDFDSARVNRIFELFAKALKCDQSDAVTLFQYARFLERCQRHAVAEDYYLMSLEQDPSFVEALHGYASLLQSRGDFEFAEKFLERVVSVTDLDQM